MSKPYWLIERQKTRGGIGAHWFSTRRGRASGDEDIWVEDVTRAERFATRELCEESIKTRFMFLGVFTPCDAYPVLPTATEHMDMDMDFDALEKAIGSEAE